MKKKLFQIDLYDVVLKNGKIKSHVPLFYQIFGKELGTAKIILVNHALTGNSNVTGKNGWWNDLIGENKTIDTNHFTVIAFNIPGNGCDENSENLISNYTDFSVRDVATIFWKGLHKLGVQSLFAVIGGSLGGAIAWEIAALQPEKVDNLIPIATDWKATDWLIANVLTQDRILNHSDDPIADARLHAMLLYRTPQSINERFNRVKVENHFAIEKWLDNHGTKLKNRFRLASYKLMNQLLKTIDVTEDAVDFETVALSIKAKIHLISVNSDCLFTEDETRKTFKILKAIQSNVIHHSIDSVHGHDAFLIEFEQLSVFLDPIFQPEKNKIPLNA